jgi:probable DNA repair protein
LDAVLDSLAHGASLVTANKRLARSLALAYNRRQRAAGRAVWPSPAISPWQTWLAELWSSSVEHGGAAGQRRLLSETQARLLWGEVIGSGTQLPGDSIAVARAAAGAWRLCQDWRITPRDLANEADSDDTRLFASWAGDYAERCRSRGLADAGMLPELLAEDLRHGKLRLPRQLWLSGFEEWAPAQREFLRIFAATGCEIHEQPAPRTETHLACRVSCRDEHEELELAARWARQQVSSQGQPRVAVVVPDLASRLPQVRRAFLDVFSPDWRLSVAEELPVNFSYGESLATNGLAHAGMLILQSLTGNLDFRDAGQLLRSPYVNGGADLATRARVDLEMRERAGRHVGLRRLAAMSETAAPEFARRIEAIADMARGMPSRQRTAGWADSFREALRRAGCPGDRPLASDEYQAAKALHEQFDALAGCDALAGLVDYTTAFGLLRSLVGETVFQPAGHPDAVQVLGTIEALGQQFDALWICGLTSGAWPPAASPNPFLPLTLQRRLRLPDSSPAAARERAERRLRWLEGSAAELILSYPAFAGDEPLAPSPLVMHVPEKPPTQLRVWPMPLQAAALAIAGATESLLEDPAPPIGLETAMHGGAALLERQARCPARAFLQYRLGARELGSPSPGIDPALRGTIAHDALQALFERIGGHDALCRLDDAAETRLLREVVGEQVGRALRHADPAMRRIGEAERARLEALFRQFLRMERDRPAFTVASTEEPLGSRTGPESIARLQIRLRADRIDMLPDGRRLVIDYKTGGSLPSAADLCGPRPRAPQLPLYATLTDADAVAFVHVGAAGIRWFGVGHGSWGIPGIVEPAKLTRREVQDWGALRASWWMSLERLAGELLAGDFRVDRWRRRDAQGQWAMATRIYELPDDEAPDA